MRPSKKLRHLSISALHLISLSGRAQAQSDLELPSETSTLYEAPLPSETSPWGPVGSCGLTGCILYGAGPEIFSWVTEREESLSTEGLATGRETLTAFTVVTVYNTVASTSRVTTIYNELPDGYTLPDTNSDGTRVTTITYTRFDTPSTTVVTYPTPFYDWPDYYGWAGILTLTEGAGNASAEQCIIGSPSTLVQDDNFEPPTPRFLTSNPQVTAVDPDPDADPYGLNFGLAEDLNALPWGQAAQFFPDELPLQSCLDRPAYPSGGPRLGSWDPYWIHAETSTSYEGGDEAPVTPTDEPTGERAAPPGDNDVDGPTETPEPPPGDPDDTGVPEPDTGSEDPTTDEESSTGSATGDSTPDTTQDTSQGASRSIPLAWLSALVMGMMCFG